MSRFLTSDVFLARYGDELLELTGTGGFNTPDGPSHDMARIDGAVTYANARVAGMVLGRYPHLTEHPLLCDAAIDIARYRLRSEAGNATISDEVRKRHDDALKLLADVQAGRQALMDDNGQPLGEADGAGGTVMGSVMVVGGAPERVSRTLEGYL